MVAPIISKDGYYIVFTPPVTGTVRLYNVSNGVPKLIDTLDYVNLVSHFRFEFQSGSSWCVTLEVNGVVSPFSNTITFQ